MVQPSQATGKIHGFYDHAIDWVVTIIAVGFREAWSDQEKLWVAIDDLREGTAAWLKYEGMRQHSWAACRAALMAGFGQIICDSSEPNATFAEDRAREGPHLKGATMNDISLAICAAGLYEHWTGALP